jgi:hypothetical protein
MSSLTNSMHSLFLFFVPARSSQYIGVSDICSETWKNFIQAWVHLIVNHSGDDTYLCIMTKYHKNNR